MKTPASLLLALLVAALVAFGSRSQAFTVYTNSTDFFNAVTSGSFTTNFSSVPDFNFITGSTNFSGNGYEYTVMTTSNNVDSSLFGLQNIPGPGITVYLDNDSLVFTNFNYPLGSGGFGIGGNWFSTDGAGTFQNQPVTLLVTLSDSSFFSTNYTPATFGDSYIGLLTTTNITSVVVSGPGVASGYYGTASNVSVVPEPSTYALLGLAAAGLAGYVIRRRRS